MVSVLFHSLNKACGIDDFHLTALIGAPTGEEAASAAFAEWLAPEIRSVIVDPNSYDAHGFHASAGQRFELPTDADLVVCLDADMVACGDLTELVADIVESPAIAGVIAHVQPLSHQQWAEAYAKTGSGTPTFPYNYSGWPYMWPKDRRSPGAIQAPPYFNFGFVAIPAEILLTIREHYWQSSQTIERLFPGNMFRSQIALTLAIEKAGAPHTEIGMRYNFPNDFMLEALHADELKEARLIHLLRRNDLFDKQQAFRDMKSLNAFVATEWETAGALERARQMIAEVLPAVEAMSLPDKLAPTHWLW